MKQDYESLDHHVPSPSDVILGLLEKVTESRGATIVYLFNSLWGWCQRLKTTVVPRANENSNPYESNKNLEALLAWSHFQTSEAVLQVQSFGRKEEEDLGVGGGWRHFPENWAK